MITTTQPITPPEPQRQDEHAEAYALRILRFIAESGTALCTLDQLKQADRFYPLIVWNVESCTAEASAKMQRRITKTIQEREAQIDQWFATFAQDEPEAVGDQDSSQGDNLSQDEQLDPRDRALRLMRAALTMIMQPPGPDGKGPGSRVPVSPRPPKFPPSNAAQAIPQVPSSQPTTRSIADFQF